MSVRGTLFSIFGVTIAAFGLIAWTLYKSIADFKVVQETTAAVADDLFLYMDLTIQTSRYVKESLEELDGDKTALQDLTEAKAAAMKALDELAAVESRSTRADQLINDEQGRAPTERHLPKVRARFEEVVREIEAVRGKNPGKSDEDLKEVLQEELEDSYDRDFNRTIDAAIRYEQARSRASAQMGERIVQRVQRASAGATITALLFILVLVGARLRSMERSVRLLVEGAERLAGGDLDRRIPDLGKNELGQIGASFNRMAEGLASAQALKIRTERLAAVGQAAASVGHDLRNPLGAIGNAVHYLKRRVSTTEIASDARVEQFFGVIEKELAASTKIIGDLLDFARERKLNLSACPLRPLVEDALSVVRPPRPMQIENHVPEDLPVPSVDKDQIRQALVNLLQNAAEAVPEGREGRVAVTAAATEDAVTLSITDNGDGIPDEERARIFEPFFTTKTKGTGLGLAISEGILRRHKGAMDVQSEVGRGTTVSMKLPRGSAAHADASPDPIGEHQ